MPSYGPLMIFPNWPDPPEPPDGYPEECTCQNVFGPFDRDCPDHGDPEFFEGVDVRSDQPNHPTTTR
jgi:hypothetical protein